MAFFVYICLLLRVLDPYLLSLRLCINSTLPIRKRKRDGDDDFQDNEEGPSSSKRHKSKEAEQELNKDAELSPKDTRTEQGDPQLSQDTESSPRDTSRVNSPGDDNILPNTGSGNPTSSPGYSDDLPFPPVDADNPSEDGNNSSEGDCNQPDDENNSSDDYNNTSEYGNPSYWPENEDNPPNSDENSGSRDPYSSAASGSETGDVQEKFVAAYRERKHCIDRLGEHETPKTIQESEAADTELAKRMEDLFQELKGDVDLSGKAANALEKLRSDISWYSKYPELDKLLDGTDARIGSGTPVTPGIATPQIPPEQSMNPRVEGDVRNEQFPLDPNADTAENLPLHRPGIFRRIFWESGDVSTDSDTPQDRNRNPDNDNDSTDADTPQDQDENPNNDNDSTGGSGGAEGGQGLSQTPNPSGQEPSAPGDIPTIYERASTDVGLESIHNVENTSEFLTLDWSTISDYFSYLFHYMINNFDISTIWSFIYSFFS